MPRKIVKTVDDNYQPSRPALTPEAQENHMIALAMDLAEKQLREGTASSQVVCHFLKLATVKDQLELEKIRNETELAKAKADNLKSSQRSEEMIAAAIEAFKSYKGAADTNDSEDVNLF